MTRVAKIVRFVLLGSLAVGVLSACGFGDSDDDPTQTPVVVTSESSATSEEAQARTSPTAAATAALQPTALPTVEPTATSAPSPTSRPTAAPMPSPTRAPIVAPTPSPTPVPSVELPEDPLSILPTLADVPAGMVIVDEGEASIGRVAADFDDAGAREQQLLDWGFRGAFFREVELPSDQIVDQPSQPIAMVFQVMLLGSPEAAQLELNSFIDDAVLADPDVNAEEIAIDPIGDTTRAVFASADTPDQGQINVAIVGFTAGPFSMHYIAAGGELFDPVPDLITASRAALDYLGYSGFPTIGEVLLESDFSAWFTGELDSGVIAIDENGYYHILVNQGDGSFISAYSTDHEPFADVAVSVDMRYLGGDPSSQGCVLTRVDQLEQLYDYSLCVDGNGNVEALYEQFDAEGNYSSEPLLPAGAVAVAAPLDWTTLTIITRGDEFWFAINGEVIDSVRHTGPPAGSVGVIVNHFVPEPQLPAEFLFTNLVVQAVQ